MRIKAIASFVGLLIVFCIASTYVFDNTETATVYSTAVADEPTPLQIVEAYCLLAEKGEYDKLQKYTTDYPDEYFVAKAKETDAYLKMQGKPPIIVAENNSVKDKGTLMLPAKTKRPKRPNVVAEKLDAEMIYRNAAFIKKVQNIWINGNEARVRVEVGSRTSAAFKDQWDFLLYREENHWKLFLVDTPSLVNIYGIPEHQ